MSTILDLLQKWFSDRPQWLQIAAARLLQQSEDISELTTLCQQEADGILDKASCFFPVSAFSQTKSGSVRLCSISNIKGVNALSPKSPLEFGKKNITIVFGNNGSGKSGYVRLLKHVCGAREPGPLHNNVYNTSSTLQKADISFELNGNSKKYLWLGQGVCDDLRNINIFDTSFGKVFISGENEVSYEPPVLSFFSSLILICEKVAAKLVIEANRYPSKKPNMPADKKTTPEGVWYENINTKTTSQDIDMHCAFNESEMQRLQKRLNEQAPAKKAKQLRTQKLHIETLVQDAEKYLDQLSEENCQQIKAAKKKIIQKKAAAESAANKVFSNSELGGIGSDVWKELWEAARKYSLSVAYVETEYPHVSEGSRCVLCQQTLTQEAKERLTSFENFIKKEIQKNVVNAEVEYENVILTIEELPASETLKTKMDAAGISLDEKRSQIMEFFNQLQRRRKQLLGADPEETLIPLPYPNWIEEAKTDLNILHEQAVRFEEDAKVDNRDALNKELHSLQARKWLSEHRLAIDEEIKRLNLLSQIQNAKKLTTTKALSQKKGELSETFITNGFVQRFNSELKALGAAQIKIELVKSKVSKGRVLHKFQLIGVTQIGLDDVLSEGENQIVSIAAFLADVTGTDSKAAYVFDDPISSLDQTYEETVAQRLIELSHNMQVIVFTHRLSFLGTIKHFSDKKDIKFDLISIRSSDRSNGEPASFPLSQSDIKTALNILINQRYQEAKNAYENSEFEQSDNLLKGMCSDFRILVERCIENDLLCGVVQRFQRPISTLKLKQLAKLESIDCILLDSLMTKYSGFEHSQPEESPVNLPNPDELKVDMEKLKDWRNEYASRSLSNDVRVT